MVNKFIIFIVLILMTMSTMAKEYPFVDNEILVKLKVGSSSASFFANKQLDINLKNEISLSYGKLYVVKNNSKKDIFEIIKDLKNNPLVQYAEPNYIFSIPKKIKNNINNKKMLVEGNYFPNDPKFSSLWGFYNTDNPGVDINIIKAWNISRGSNDVTVGVIDTGIDYNHIDLKDNIWTNTVELNGEVGVDDDGNGYIDDIHGYDFVNDDGDPMDGSGHGSHCAGVIGAVHNNGEGIAGINQHIKIVALKFLSDGGYGSTEDAIKAIDYASKMRIDVLSNAWGGGPQAESLKEAIEAASQNGVLFVAAAGNSAGNNDDYPHYPSSYDTENIISVAAHTSADRLASFSCYGRKSVDITAPGQNILSTMPDNSYATMSGTSMATPHVAGALALLISYTGRMSHDKIKKRLFTTSQPVRAYRAKTYSGGRLNVYNLLSNFIPDRPNIDDADWVSVSFDVPFESSHPYKANENLIKVIRIPGAKYIRVVIDKYETELKYDYIKIIDASDEEIEKISGAGTQFTTDFTEGDYIKIDFRSDSTQHMWGFKITKVEVVY